MMKRNEEVSFTAVALVFLTEPRWRHTSRLFGRDGGETRIRRQLKFASRHYVAPLSNNKTETVVETGATEAPLGDT